MKYHRSLHFRKDFEALPSDIQAAVAKAFILFKDDPHHKSLRIKKMEGFKDIWEGHITKGYVFTFHFENDPETDEAITYFRRVGKHDEVYANP